MQKLTTPKAILFGLGLIALAIASVPYSSSLVKTAHANQLPITEDGVLRVELCGVGVDLTVKPLAKTLKCAMVTDDGMLWVKPPISFNFGK